MAKMTGFVFQDKYLARLSKLTDEEVGRLVRALSVYHATGEEQDLTGRECGCYDFIKEDIDEIENRYAEKCERNRQIRQQALSNVDVRQRTSTDDNQNKIKEKDKDKDIKEIPINGDKEKRKRFSPPSVEDVAAYCKERGNKVNAQTFVDFYSAKGWKVGQNPMKDWKACVRTWEQRDNYGGTTPQRPRLLRAQDYKQREYNGKQLESVLGVDDIYAEGAS